MQFGALPFESQQRGAMPRHLHLRARTGLRAFQGEAQFPIRLVSLPARGLGHDEDEGVEARIVLLDAAETVVDGFARADRPGAHSAGKLVDGELSRWQR